MRNPARQLPDSLHFLSLAQRIFRLFANRDLGDQFFILGQELAGAAIDRMFQFQVQAVESHLLRFLCGDIGAYACQRDRNARIVADNPATRVNPMFGVVRPENAKGEVVIMPGIDAALDRPQPILAIIRVNGGTLLLIAHRVIGVAPIVFPALA